MKTNGNGNGSRRAQEIQAEIERTRQEMDGTLNAIEHRLTPGQLYDQGIQYLRNSGGSEFLSNLGDQAKGNPMPVALVGIGLAWLIATQKSTGTPADPRLGEKAAETKALLGQQVERARSGVDTLMREQPLALGAMGLAIGALAAALTPRTRYEDQVVGPVKDELAGKAAEQVKPTQAPYAERAETEPPV